MQYISEYDSPLGTITLSGDESALTGLWISGQEYSSGYLRQEHKVKELSLFKDVKRWLDIYFSGKEPDFGISVRFNGSVFQNEVWTILCSVPYGETVTYGEIARIIAGRRGLARMSAQAVGGAVGKNPISIIVPCHRVMGANGNLTGYAGGIDKKIALLKLENAYKDNFFVPKRGTAL